MENSAYVSPPPMPPTAHLSSAAAAAFQAACNNTNAGLNFQEALLSRMSRGHFGLTVRNSFCTSSLYIIENKVLLYQNFYMIVDHNVVKIIILIIL